MKNKPRRKFQMLPPYFKLIGLALIFAAFISIAIIILTHIQLGKAGKELIELSSKTVFIFGLLFIAWAKDRNENENLMEIRLRSFISAFLNSVFYVLIVPFSNLTRWPIGHQISGFEMIFLIFAFYLMSYYWEKLKVSRKRKIELKS